jgi:hypothetical protein
LLKLAVLELISRKALQGVARVDHVAMVLKQNRCNRCSISGKKKQW